MTRTITVNQTEPRSVLILASDEDETLARHLRRALNALGGLEYSAFETKALAERLQEDGTLVMEKGRRTVVLTEHAGSIPGDARMEHGEFIVELEKGDEPIPEFVSVDHPLLGRLHIYRHVDVDDETYIVVDIDSAMDKPGKPPVRVYIDDASIFVGDSADEREE